LPGCVRFLVHDHSTFASSQAHSVAPDVSVKQFVVIMMMGSSTAFVTPLGYVTSVMVQRVGQHTFAEFAKLGFALQVGLGFLSVALTQRLIP
jgi:di/tricarboxylate transporter